MEPTIVIPLTPIEAKAVLDALTAWSEDASDQTYDSQLYDDVQTAMDAIESTITAFEEGR